MVSSIGFRSTTPQVSTFQDMISRPQTYIQKETPAAASSLKDGKNKKGSAGKVIAGLLVGTAAVTAGLLYAGRHPEKLDGLISKFKDGKLKTNLIKVGNKIVEMGEGIDSKVVKPVSDKISGLFNTIKEKGFIETIKSIIPKKTTPAG